jgi:hypothetical protein
VVEQPFAQWVDTDFEELLCFHRVAKRVARRRNVEHNDRSDAGETEHGCKVFRLIRAAEDDFRHPFAEAMSDDETHVTDDEHHERNHPKEVDATGDLSPAGEPRQPGKARGKRR